jgi:hypothetical protein
MNYLFMTQIHHDVITLVIVMFFSIEINTLARADVAVLVIFLADVKMLLSRPAILNIALLVQNHYAGPHPLCEYI